MRITITQARQRLAALGFEMGKYGTPNWGMMSPPELFTHGTTHVLSPPFRDVFIGKAKGGWYITSHIKFSARRFRARLYNTYTEELKNIFGHGRTLLDAIQDFENNFNLKVYNQR